MPDARTHYKTMYDAIYIGSWDLPEKDLTVTISKVVGEELTSVGGRKNKKPILSFEGAQKGMVLNKTNSKTVATMYGPYVEQWIGKRITLYKAVTHSPEGEVDCIRVRPAIPGAKS